MTFRIADTAQKAQLLKINAHKNMPVALVVGVFGSGKTAHLLKRACQNKKRVLLVLASPWHAAQIEDDLPVQAKTLHVAWPSQLASVEDDTFLRLFDVILLDNIDAFINNMAGMFSIATRVLALAQKYPDIDVVGTARGAVAGWPEPCDTLKTSWRMKQNGHAALLKALLSDTCRVLDNVPKFSVHATTSNAETVEKVWSLLMGHVPHNTVVLCNNENTLRAVQELLPNMNAIRARQGMPMLNKLATYTIQNFMGCESQFTLLILESQDVIADIVEGMTRHTDRLAIFFPAAAPPNTLCRGAHVLAPMLPASVFVNWAPRQPQMAAKKFAHLMCAEALDFQMMVNTLMTKLGASHSTTCSTIMPARKPIPQSVKCDAALLGTVVEHLTVECFGLASPLRQHAAFATVQRAVAEDGWWTMEEERTMWQQFVNVNEPVSHHYFSAVCARARCLKTWLALNDPQLLRWQVPVKFKLPDCQTEISGSADFASSEVVVEIKHTEVLGLPAYAQTLTYMHALGVKRGYIFNVRTFHLEQLTF